MLDSEIAKSENENHNLRAVARIYHQGCIESVGREDRGHATLKRQNTCMNVNRSILR